ncbi:ComF family protein [Actinomadura macrotermitis]|uniref:Phosphoribosyltransferase domain-containing protein n=1 Tax=Actinomadura macrotermitis TaxID=2585200 RepID=A0A7K0C0Y8_9ACTN|nr:phosphoribosyltransferase family protein [Actinomadura macrotermitis]MQY07107.1 hypothetical protein [Actinomadura macrotermitis]
MRLLSDLYDLLLPARCAGCGRAPGLVCRKCTDALELPARRVDALKGAPPTWTAVSYEGPVKALIAAHKEAGRLPLAGPLGTALARAVAAAIGPPHPPRGAGTAPGPGPPGDLLVVPMPSARAATRRRGHDPVRRMTAAAVRALRADGYPVLGLDALRHRRAVADQAALTGTARAANLRDAMEARPAHLPARVVLADDIVTTGATLAEATRTLTRAGAEVIAAATVAATPRRR